MKKQFLIFILFILTNFSFAQNIDYNLEDGYIADGYDVVSYFQKKAKKGSSKLIANYKGAKYKFSNQVNFNTFKKNPSKYAPQYGGWCAYALGAKGKKVSIDPKTYEIRDGKLYLFYNAYFNNTYDSWIKEGPKQLKAKADKNWARLKYKK